MAVVARAAGWWRVRGDRLEQVAFAAAADMPAEVARGFAEATRSVPLSLSALGIVKAAVGARVVVSRAAGLPPDHGSGLWLRRFTAARSVAVPVSDDTGAVRRVVSVALHEASPADAELAEFVRQAAAAWPEPMAG